MSRTVNVGKTTALPAMYDTLTWQQRGVVRDRYVDLQENKCWYCKHQLDGPATDYVQHLPINLRLFPPGLLKNPIHLQHDHDTGLTEGAVHARCNAVLWQYEGR